ncbi:hypothetical protein A2Z33_03250 [Candidatus Gottesmanbacteria bacterium RBG_16_52_11]|uniref:Mur ligase C-terminal domain-containing protein n=1 Tax=Candidatus Gottesmanbacteria bacterium RBG_16_52_11 TaxID=1798374 RepID=A0A1F5YVA6_9BACT|nr:MAG: hypothetical protein A2Z33_03250 [Candidatus Gottesmanbacteria bacterium RBG_16_52_11]
MEGFKRVLYFSVARYFRLFAWIRFRIWHPTVIVVTGSSGKTTLLHFIQSQLGSLARYSHDANSAIGIPFDLLDLHRQTLLPSEWPLLFLKAPFKAFSPKPRQALYVVEADCDRPGEGRFLASFLKPHVTLWINVSRTHSMNFDRLIRRKKFPSHETAVAREFGYFPELTRKLVIVNGDSPLISGQLYRCRATIHRIRMKQLAAYRINGGTSFTIGTKVYRFRALLPRETYYTIAATLELLGWLRVKPDAQAFNRLILPPGRSSRFPGVKGTTIIDSSYNANFDSMKAVLGMFESLPASPKWVVLSDMLEQGAVEREEHEKLATLVSGMKLDRIVFMGPRTFKYTVPAFRARQTEIPFASFQTPREVLDYLKKSLRGRETVLFKGGRFLEGVIGHLLADPDDIRKLCRREEVWQRRRKQWGL